MTILQLQEWQDYTGILKNFFYNERESTIKFNFLSGDSVSFSFYTDLDNNFNFKEMIGRKIGILRTDLRENEYIIRCENIKNKGG